MVERLYAIAVTVNLNQIFRLGGDCAVFFGEQAAQSRDLCVQLVQRAAFREGQ